MAARTADGSPRAALAILAVIVAVGAMVRLWAIGWGGPFAYHPDESIIVKSAIRIVETGDWNPHTFYYPSLMIDLEAVLVTVLHLLTGMPLATDQAWLFGSEALPAQFPAFVVGRIAVSLMGLATLGVTYQIGSRLGSRWAGVIAAGLVALAPLHIQSSRYITTDVPMTLFCTLTILASVRGSQEPGRERWWLLAAVFAGLAASTKWNAATIAIVPALLYLWTRPGPWRVLDGVRSRTPYLMAAGAILALVVTTPAIVLSPMEVLDYLRLQATLYSIQSWNEQTQGLAFQMRAATFHMSWAGGLLAIAGAVRLVVRGGAVGRAMATFVVLYTILLAIPAVHFERNFLPAYPPIAIGSGMLLAVSAWPRPGVRPDRTGRARLVRTAVVVGVIAATVIPVLGLDVGNARTLRRADTRTVALEWVRKHVPHSAILAREQYTPQLTPLEYRMRNRDFLALRSLDWYRELGVNYLIVSSANYLRFMDNPAAPEKDRFYRDVFQLPEVLRVDPGDDRPGYTIRIFRLLPIDGGP